LDDLRSCQPDATAARIDLSPAVEEELIGMTEVSEGAYMELETTASNSKLIDLVWRSTI